ncbi:28591_t:CDS:2, partial [Racocetra persica]
MSSNDISFVKSEKAKGKKRLNTVTDKPEINDIFEKVNKRIKTQEIENNKIFSKLSDNEKEIVVNARSELEKMSFLQIRALHVALILRKNIFLTGDAGTGKTRVLKFIIAYYSIIHQVNIEITASTGKAALELKSSDKGYCDWLRKVRAIIIDECLIVNDDLLDSIIHLFTRSGITELGKVHFIITGDFFQLPPASGGKDMIITGLDTSDYIKEIRNIDPSLRMIKQITSSEDSR